MALEGSSCAAIDGPVSTAMRPIAVAAERSAPPLAMRKIVKKRFGLNQRGAFVCFLALSGFRFFILLTFLVLVFSDLGFLRYGDLLSRPSSGYGKALK